MTALLEYFDLFSRYSRALDGAPWGPFQAGSGAKCPPPLLVALSNRAYLNKISVAHGMIYSLLIFQPSGSPLEGKKSMTHMNNLIWLKLIVYAILVGFSPKMNGTHQNAAERSYPGQVRLGIGGVEGDSSHVQSEHLVLYPQSKVYNIHVQYRHAHNIITK